MATKFDNDYVTHLQTEYVNYLKSLYHEGIVDEKFTEQLQKIQNDEIQNEGGPYYLIHVLGHFFHQTEERLIQMNVMLVGVYFNLEDEVHQVYQNCSRFGALRVKKLCHELKVSAMDRNREECRKLLYRVHEEVCKLKTNLFILSNMEYGIRAADGTIPVFNGGDCYPLF